MRIKNAGSDESFQMSDTASNLDKSVATIATLAAEEENLIEEVAEASPQKVPEGIVENLPTDTDVRGNDVTSHFL